MKNKPQKDRDDNTNELKELDLNNFDFGSLDIRNPAKNIAIEDWIPSNQYSIYLISCLEAIRDLTVLLEALETKLKSESERRILKLMITPIYCLAEHIKKIFNKLQSDSHKTNNNNFSKIKQKADVFYRDVPLEKASELKTLRDKVDSHIDKDTILDPMKYWKEIKIVIFFNWIAQCIKHILFLMDYDIFAWTMESNNQSSWKIMNIDSYLVEFSLNNGEVFGINKLIIVKSPKYAILKEIVNLVPIYNKIVTKYNNS